MPGAHTYIYTQYSLTYKFTLHPWPRIMDSAGKEKVTKPAHGPPLQARVAAANGTVLAACKLLLAMMILAHME